MFSASSVRVAILMVLSAACGAPQADTSARQELLRVCADPNNLPFSNDRGEGFENHLAALIARDLGRNLQYTWWPHRRGFLRNTLNARRCDLIMGVPSGYDPLATTRPYYRSTFVFVTRRAQHLDIRSFNDPRLRALRIGVHTIGDDYANVPPVQALAERGLADRVRGYSIYGAYSKPDPPRALIDGVAAQEIDVAIAWGPLAGYFARRQPIELAIERVAHTDSEGTLPMTFGIAMGVRRDDPDFKALIDGVIARRHEQIRELLLRYGVPLVEEPSRMSAEVP